MYLSMGEKIAEKQEVILIIEVSSATPIVMQNVKKITLWAIYEKLVVNYFVLLHMCLHCAKVFIC